MFKKLALALGCLGFLVATTPVFGICIGDVCHVENPKVIEVGYDLNIDVDVCVDAGNLVGDFWSTEAVIYQDGQHNEATIDQNSVSQTAGIIQDGTHNSATISQTRNCDYALILQDGTYNTATITQNLAFADALIIQAGSHNSATINQ